MCLASLAALLLVLFASPPPAFADTYVVNDQGDGDDGACDARNCTLREAIEAANAHPGPDTIVFNFESGSPFWTIWLSDSLPTITDPGTTIDGTSMPEHLGGPSVVLVGDEEITAIRTEADSTTVRGLRFSGFGSPGRAGPLTLYSDGNLVEGNVIGNSTQAMLVGGEGNRILNNLIGVTPWGDPSPIEWIGILLYGSGARIEGNTIAHSGVSGLYLMGEPERPAIGNTFSRNSIYDSGGLGIDFEYDEAGTERDVNNGIDAPDLTSVGLTEVSGAACRGCTVELFLADPDPTEYGEGMTFIGDGVADGSGRFTITLDTPLDACDPVTSTATDPDGNTSRFGLNRLAGDGLCLPLGAPPPSEPYLTVNTTDDHDDGACTEAHCSLREAIDYANAHLGQDTVSFDIAGPSPHVVLLLEALPSLSDDRTFLDGTSEPDYDGDPAVWIDGGDFVADCLWVASSRNTIAGLGIRGCGRADSTGGWPEPTGAGIRLDGGHNRLEANRIVENGWGILVLSRANTITGNAVQGNDVSGLRLDGDDNLVGGAAPGETNLITGNGQHGIDILWSVGNRILGNRIGLGPDGEVLPNEVDGIMSQAVAVIGGLSPGEGNLIAGNGRNGVTLRDTATETVLAGNEIHDNAGYGVLLDYPELEAHTITRNSMWDNAELGIETRRVDDHVPVLAPAGLSEVEGSACPGCLVEVFLAAPDPTGFGEGRTFLGEARADAAGRLSLTLSGVASCDELTATVTDAAGNTSRFSENVLVNCLSLPGVPMAASGLGAGFLLVLVLVVVRRYAPQLPAWTVPLVGFAVPGLVGFVLLIAAVHPNMEVNLGSTVRPEVAGAPPSCAEYLDAAGFAPDDGVMFEIEADPDLVWMPEGSLPAETWRWRVDLRAPDQRLRSLTTEGVTLSFSAFGFEPRAGGRYHWRVVGEALDAAAGRWTEFCRADASRSFIFRNPLILIAEQVEPEEPSMEVPPVTEACGPVATAIRDANCREGPSEVYEVVGYLMQGQSAEIEGRNAESNWWYLRPPDESSACWVWGGLVETTCDTEGLPVIPAPPTPIPPPTATEPPADATPPSAPTPTAPTGGVSLTCAGYVQLNWNAVTDPSGIQVYTLEVQRSSDQANWSSVAGSPWLTAATYHTLPVECGWYYRWRVRATDGAGNPGPYSSWALFSVILP